MTITVNKTGLKLVLNKLDDIKVELLKHQTMLLHEEEASEEEKKENEAARKEIVKVQR